jgi:Tfp pilus assembly protein PilF
VKEKTNSNEKTRLSSLAFSLLLLVSTGGLASLTGCQQLRPTAASFLIRGNEYFKMNEYEKAEHEYREALLSEPKSATALNNLGVILNERSRYDDAISILTQAIEVDPKNAIAHYVLSEAYAKNLCLIRLLLRPMKRLP